MTCNPVALVFPVTPAIDRAVPVERVVVAPNVTTIGVAFVASESVPDSNGVRVTSPALTRPACP